MFLLQVSIFLRYKQKRFSKGGLNRKGIRLLPGYTAIFRQDLRKKVHPIGSGRFLNFAFDIVRVRHIHNNSKMSGVFRWRGGRLGWGCRSWCINYAAEDHMSLFTANTRISEGLFCVWKQQESQERGIVITRTFRDINQSNTTNCNLKAELYNFWK